MRVRWFHKGARNRGPPMIHRIASIVAIAFGCSLGWAASSLAQDIQERTIRWGHLNKTDHPVSKGVQRFAEIVAAKSGGKLKIKEFPANQLGTEQQQQSALRGGRLGGVTSEQSQRSRSHRSA